MSNRRLTRAQRRALYRRRVRESLRRADVSFKGKYKDEINELMGLSRDEIDAITPDMTDMLVYKHLMTVVEEASRINLAQADLKAQILEIGKIAVEIARKVPSLRGIIGDD
ncbi:MAG: hypothetical protein GY838_10025 [bacterium]|nr:hypothetical protein [bacterium]